VVHIFGRLGLSLQVDEILVELGDHLADQVREGLREGFEYFLELVLAGG
jgi:hypothetical protein